jgi:hypothetical protein
VALSVLLVCACGMTSGYVPTWWFLEGLSHGRPQANAISRRAFDIDASKHILSVIVEPCASQGFSASSYGSLSPCLPFSGCVYCNVLRACCWRSTLAPVDVKRLGTSDPAVEDVPTLEPCGIAMEWQWMDIAVR